jgi:hypothetical protein
MVILHAVENEAFSRFIGVGWDKLALGERRPTIATSRWAGARTAVLSHLMSHTPRGIEYLIHARVKYNSALLPSTAIG